MSEFLVEVYVSRVAADGRAPADEALSQAAEQLTREGRPVRFLRSIFVPDDETCFYLYRAQSVEAVHAALARIGLRFERVSEVVSDGASPHH